MPSEAPWPIGLDDVAEEELEEGPAGVTPEQLTDETTECSFGCPALAIWARHSPGSACTFGPLPWRCELPDVTVGTAACGVEIDSAFEDGEEDLLMSEELPGAWDPATATELGALPIEVAAVAAAVPAPTERITAITAAFAGIAFENILHPPWKSDGASNPTSAQ